MRSRNTIQDLDLKSLDLFSIDSYAKQSEKNIETTLDLRKFCSMRIVTVTKLLEAWSLTSLFIASCSCESLLGEISIKNCNYQEI